MVWKIKIFIDYVFVENSDKYTIYKLKRAYFLNKIRLNSKISSSLIDQPTNFFFSHTRAKYWTSACFDVFIMVPLPNNLLISCRRQKLVARLAHPQERSLSQTSSELKERTIPNSVFYEKVDPSSLPPSMHPHFYSFNIFKSRVIKPLL